MKTLTMNIMGFLGFVFLGACAGTSGEPPENNPVDPKDECVFCDEKADAFGIARESYLAYGIVNLANDATFEELDDDVPLDVRAARGIVDGRPFEYIEQIDTVYYVGRVAFSNMADYAQDNGYVPYCGDGSLQSILEACDDGNSADGDGCSSTCEVEEGNPANDFLAEQPELIKGSDINVPIVDPGTYYLRERSYHYLGLPDDVEGILDRADGIKANEEANDIVSFDELAIMSKEPFFSSLFDDEQEALKEAWKIFEVSDAPVAVIDYTGDPIQDTVPFTPTIERVGPLAVDPVRDIDDLEGSTLREVCRRLQRMAGTNADGDDETVELADVEKALADYDQVFTSYEMRLLGDLHDLFFLDAEPSSGGDFAIEFAEMPNENGFTSVVLAAFDDYEFTIHHKVEIAWHAYDPRTDDYPSYGIDANLRSEFTLRGSLYYKGDSDPRACGYWSHCVTFDHEDVRFMRLDGEHANGGHDRGLLLMEHWDDGKRIYNRLVDFQVIIWEKNGVRTYQNEYATARPQLADGTFLSTRKGQAVDYGSRDYRDYYLAEVQTKFNRNVEKFFPESYDMIERHLKVGRYEEFDGVVLEVHDSRAVIAYFDGCELPLSYQDGALESAPCPATGRWVKIKFGSPNTYLKVIDWTDASETILYSSNQYTDELDLDRSYYVIQ